MTDWDENSGPGVHLRLCFPDESAYAATVETLVADEVGSRITAEDPTLWGPEAEKEAAKRLDWVSLPRSSRPLLSEIAALRPDLVARGVTRVVLCGMGGSSLAPEVICAAAGGPLEVPGSSNADTVRDGTSGDRGSTHGVVTPTYRG